MIAHIEEAAGRATAALAAMRDRIGGRPYYAWAWYWHPAGRVEWTWTGSEWEVVCTSPKAARATPEIRLSVSIQGTREQICQGELIWKAEGPTAATVEPQENGIVRG